MNKYYVYKLQIEDDPEPFYIGKGSGNRLNHHVMPYELSKNTHKSYKIRKALKNGKRVLSTIIKDNLTEDGAFDLEISLISKYGRADSDSGYLVNKCDGGKGSTRINVSSNTKKKLSDASKRRTITGHTRKKLSAANKGKMVVFDKNRNVYVRITVNEYKENKSTYETALDRRNASGIKPPNVTGKTWSNTQETKNKKVIAQWNKRVFVWELAEKYYKLYCSMDKKNAYQLSIITGLPDSYFGAMVQRFKAGWVPSDDPLWTAWMCERDFII